MTRIREVKTTFTAGELSEDLLGRGDLTAYENGAKTLRNVFINPTGGVTRRAGLAYIDTLAGAGKLIPFEFNTAQTYLLAFTDALISIYAGGVLETTITSPWAETRLPDIAYTQSADTLLLVHPNVPPYTLTRQSGGSWSLQEWSFFSDEDLIYQPYYKFASSEATLTPSATSGTITLTASEDIFTADHENTILRIGEVEALITDFDSATVVTATLSSSLSSADATIDWSEQAFSAARGYPATVAFHQDRLVIGGSRDLPNRLWMSKSGDLFNFDTGTGLDDESIAFSILSDQVNAIRGIFSGRHLQVFTSGAEWMVTGDPLTPTSLQVLRQTRVGSLSSRHIPPVNVDGATLYVTRSGRQIHEFLYTDLEAAYTSTDLALLSRHMIEGPIDMDYDQGRRLLYVAREDGKFAALTVFRAEKVAAWTLHETPGAVTSVAVAGDETYMLVLYEGAYMIAQLDDALNTDLALTGEVETPSASWSGLDHLEGQEVTIIADGIPQTAQTVSSGAITLSQAASTIEVGLPFTHKIEPLPPNSLGQSGGDRKIRLIKASLRVQETQSLHLDIGRGLRAIPLQQWDDALMLDTAPPQVSTDITVRALGWAHDLTQALWRIEQETPLTFSLLSVTAQIKVND